MGKHSKTGGSAVQPTAELQEQARALTDEFLNTSPKMVNKFRDIRNEHTQAAHARVQGDLSKFDSSKGTLRAFVRARAGFALQDASRADAAGLIGARETVRNTTRTMPVNVGRVVPAGTAGDGDAITDFEPGNAAGSRIAASILDSDFEPIFDAQPATRTASALNDFAAKGSGAYGDDYSMAPAARRRYHRDVRILHDGVFYSPTERFREYAELHRLSPDDAQAFLRDPENLKRFTRPVVVVNSDASPEVLALRLIEANATAEAATAPTVVRRTTEPWYLLTLAYFDHYWPAAPTTERDTMQRDMIRFKQQHGIPRDAFRKWLALFERAAALSDRLRERADQVRAGSREGATLVPFPVRKTA